jgi:hypothetical protein
MAEQPVTLESLIARIQERAGVEITDLPQGAGLGWFPIPWDESHKYARSVSLWQRGQSSPLNPAMMIIAIFDGDDEVRVYTLAIKGGDKGGDKPKPPTRYTLSKRSFQWFSEEMEADNFVQEFAEELTTVAGIEPPPSLLEEKDEEVTVTETPTNGTASVESSPGV